MKPLIAIGTIPIVILAIGTNVAAVVKCDKVTIDVFATTVTMLAFPDA
jgi:hypothetical protein